MRILFWLAAATGVLECSSSVWCLACSSVLTWSLLAVIAPGVRATPVGATGGERKSGLLCEESTPRPHASVAGVSRIGLPMFARRLRRVRIGALLLLDDLADHARADRAAALPDGESQPLVHGDRLDQLDLHLDVVAGHDHLDAVGQLGHAGDVGRTEVELRPVAREEGGVASALLRLEHVDLGLELGVRCDGAGLAQHLAALDLLALGASQEAADVVAGLALVEDLA